MKRSATAICLTSVLLLLAGSARADVTDGAVVAAFVPQLTGDPKQDFEIVVDKEETFTIYLMAGAQPEALQSFSFGFRNPNVAAFGVSEIRAAGEVSFFQNSIGSLLMIEVQASPDCIDLSGPSVIAEVDLWLGFYEGVVDVDVIGAFENPDGSPAFVTCGGGEGDFDDSATPDLRIVPKDAVASAQNSWGDVKRSYER